MLAVSSLALPARADMNWVYADWCLGDERMTIDETGMGFNEHTVCAFVGGGPRGGVAAFRAMCANVYPNGDEVVRMDERKVEVAAGADHDSLIVRVDGQDAAAWRRCDL